MRGASILAVLAALALPGAAEACRCTGPTPRAAGRRASAVPLGTVSRAAEVSAHDRSYLIEVERSWKRRFEGPVPVNGGRTNCAADMQPGQRYLIHVIADPGGRPRTSRCLGNQPAAHADPALAWLARRG